MATLISELASLVDGRIIGDSTITCAGANPLGVANEHDITMLDDPTRASALKSSAAAAVVTTAEIDAADRTLIIVDDPHGAFTKIVAHFRPAIATEVPDVGIDSTATISDSAQIHPTATIGSGVTIGQRVVIMPGVTILPKCKIGDDCVIHPHVTLYPYTELGERVILHAGCVLGANGFGYRQVEGRHIPTAQLGYVRVDSDVEIGAAVTIDRGTYGATLIGEGTKIDNQVQIGHNCRIGKHNLLCSQVGIAGSCTTGDYVIMAGQVGLKDHIHLEDHVIIGAKAGVMNDCKKGETYLGAPATPQREQMQIMAVERKLPEMRKEVKALRRELNDLKAASGESSPASDQNKAA